MYACVFADGGCVWSRGDEIVTHYVAGLVYDEKGCPYKYVGYGDLPADTVERFWTNHVETCVDVITPNSWRQMLCSHSLSLSLSFRSFWRVL